jgi:hypothetical protein
VLRVARAAAVAEREEPPVPLVDADQRAGHGVDVGAQRADVLDEAEMLGERISHARA